MTLDIETIAIIGLIFIIILSASMPPITEKGYIKPLLGLDPVQMKMTVTKTEALPNEEVQHYAYYDYAYCYILPPPYPPIPIPVYSVMEVDVEGLANAQPTINYRYRIPDGYEFTSSPVTNYDILDNLNNLSVNTAYVFKYSWWTSCGYGTKSIGYLAYGGYDDRGFDIHSGVGDPQGPDIIEPTAYGKFHVKYIGHPSSIP